MIRNCRRLRETSENAKPRNVRLRTRAAGATESDHQHDCAVREESRRKRRRPTCGIPVTVGRSRKKRAGLFKLNGHEKRLRCCRRPKALRLIDFIARGKAENVILVIRVESIRLAGRFRIAGLGGKAMIVVLMRKNHIDTSLDAHDPHFMSAKRRAQQDRQGKKNAVYRKQKTEQTKRCHAGSKPPGCMRSAYFHRAQILSHWLRPVKLPRLVNLQRQVKYLMHIMEESVSRRATARPLLLFRAAGENRLYPSRSTQKPSRI